MVFFFYETGENYFLFLHLPKSWSTFPFLLRRKYSGHYLPENVLFVSIYNTMCCSREDTKSHQSHVGINTCV